MQYDRRTRFEDLDALDLGETREVGGREYPSQRANREVMTRILWVYRAKKDHDRLSAAAYQAHIQVSFESALAECMADVKRKKATLRS